jgi:hypothetical protein
LRNYRASLAALQAGKVDSGCTAEALEQTERIKNFDRRPLLSTNGVQGIIRVIVQLPTTRVTVRLVRNEGSKLFAHDPTKKEQPMPDEEEMTIEMGKKPDPQPTAPEEELSELDLEEVAGANCRYSLPY